MKKTMRFFSLVIAIFMICSLTTVAFATAPTGHTITITNEREGYEYTAYQIFKGDLASTGELSNIEWGNGVNGAALLTALQKDAAFAACKDVADVANVLSANSATDSAVAIRFAEIASAHVATGVKSAYNSTDKEYTISGLADGYYLVVNNKIPTGADAENTTVSRFILKVVKSVEVAHKGTFPTVDKKIVEDGKKVNVNEASIGDVVNYEIIGTLPSNIADYDSYFYWFRDTLSKGLTYNNNIKIEMTNGNTTTDVTKYFDIFVEGGNGSATMIHASITDLLELDNLENVGTITKDSVFTITYSATLNEYAETNTGNPNTVDLIYSNNPNQDGEPSNEPPHEPPTPPTEPPTPPVPTGKTPEATVITYTTKLIVEKVDQDGNPLTGAEFQLTGDGVKTTVITKQVLVQVSDTEKAPEGATLYYCLKDGTYTEVAPVEDTDEVKGTKDQYQANADGSITKDWFLKNVAEVVTKSETVAVKAFVGLDGKLSFTGLGAGTYTLTETTTPDGYNDADPVTFTISFNADKKEWSSEDIDYVAGEFAFKIQVENVKGNTLPSTGGIGTTLFYIFGSLMFAGAAVLLITKKRMVA